MEKRQMASSLSDSGDHSLDLPSSDNTQGTIDSSDHGDYRMCDSSTSDDQEEREAVERKLADQGEHEGDVFGSGPVETESLRSWTNCAKNKAHNFHDKYIPALQFTMEDLPEGFRTDLHLGYVRYISRRTVRIKVGYVSWGRPDGYTFSASRGELRTVPHWGSGWINDVYYCDGPCPCPQCADNPKTGYYEVKVHTARHIMFDDEEAKHTEVKMYYEETLSPEDDNPTVYTMRGRAAADLNFKRDLSTVVCVTHEEKLMEELSTFQAEKDQMWRALCENLVEKTESGYDGSDIDNDACVVVSHPHGQPKKISVGKLIKDLDDAGIAGLFDTYDGGTCRGSSGAPVIVWRSDGISPDPYSIPAPHRFGLRDRKNRSGGRPFYFGL